MLLFKAQKYLEIVRKRGEAGKELRRVYYNLVNQKELYLMAYKNLYANKGALTPGIDSDDTVDGMSIERIDTIRDKLKNREYEWKPARRTYTLKRDGKSKRPLGMPGWNDKMLEEVIRLVLRAYYEPQFRNSSHGFRPNRGCHTALSEIYNRWTGVQWFIEGDIKGCFDNLNHDVIIRILKRNIKDESFLRLIREMLEVGYFEDWKYFQTYSGTPQGGILSPLLANIVLNEFDTFVEEILIPKYTKGKKRRGNKENQRLRYHAHALRKQGHYREAKKLYKIYSAMPSVDYEDPNYRRLRYVRYADDFLLGYIGTKAEAEAIKEEIRHFLATMLGLTLSQEKTCITHASQGKARFLSYDIQIARQETKKVKVNVEGMRTRRRSLNGQVIFLVPQDVVKRWKARVTRKRKYVHRPELQNNSDFEIINTYERELQGLINYYTFAQNVSKKMWELRHYYQESLLKTLAAKFKTSVTKIRKKYLMLTVDKRKVVAKIIQREGKKPLKAVFGAKRIHRKKAVTLEDNINRIYHERSELIERLLAGQCELCGAEDVVVGHHINKLKNLRKKKKPLEAWEKRMIAMRRKTLFVCSECHRKIHNGTYDGRKLMKA